MPYRNALGTSEYEADKEDKETNLGECPVVAIFRQRNLGRSPDLKALLHFSRGVSEVEFVAKVAPLKTISACPLILIQ